MMFDQYDFKKRESPIAINWKEIEQAAAFPLPEDYKYFVENYHEYNGFIGPEFLQLWAYDHLLEYNNRYSIAEYLPVTFAIGGNGSGEFLAIELAGQGNYRIILSPFIDISKEYHIEIGASFSDMLVRLIDGKEWFR
jgi:hypothetical protein